MVQLSLAPSPKHTTHFFNDLDECTMQGLLALQPAATCPIKLNALGHYQGRGGGVFKSSPIPTVHNPSCKTAAKHTKLERLLQGRVVSSCWLTTVVTSSILARRKPCNISSAVTENPRVLPRTDFFRN